MTTDEVKMIEVDESRFAAVVEMKRRVDEANARYNTAREDAKDKKHALDQARETFEREFDRFVKNTNGDELPLFANQSEAIARAEADPVVMKLVERLLALGWETNAVIVFGYTEEERNQLAAWLDVFEAKKEGDPDPEPPAFLAPQLDEDDLNDAPSEAHDDDEHEASANATGLP